MNGFLLACGRLLAIVAFCFWIGFFLGCGPKYEPAATYNPDCVVKTSLMGCIDEDTYAEVLAHAREIQAESDSEYYEDSGDQYDGLGRTGGYR